MKGANSLYKLPSNWVTAPLKRFLMVKSGDMISANEETIEGYPIIGGNGVRGFTSNYNTNGPSLVIGRVGANCGNVHLIRENFWASEHAFVVFPKQKLNLEFFQYLIYSLDLNKYAIRTAQPLLNTTIVEESIGFFPPIENQNKIADFLNNETEFIDSLIAVKEKQIQLLTEKRQAIISHAVTKGINPSVKHRDSGIEWLGEMPKHWKIKKIKHLTKKIGSGVTPKGGAEVYLKEGIPLLRSQNIHFDGLKLDDVAYISEEIHNSMSGSKVQYGDVLLNITGASIGRCFYYLNQNEEANVNQHVCIVRPNELINTIYLYLFLMSDLGQNQIAVNQVGGGREGLNSEELKSFIVPLPSLDEQLQIIESVKTEVDKLDKLSFATQKSIELLKERRTTLITETVTGQLEIS